jgi:hypothetical protein
MGKVLLGLPKMLIILTVTMLALAADAPGQVARRIKALRRPPEPHAILLRNAHELGLDRGTIVDRVFTDHDRGWALEIAALRDGSYEDVLQTVTETIFRMRPQVRSHPRAQTLQPSWPNAPTVALTTGVPGETVPGTDVIIAPGQVGLRFGICIPVAQMRREGLVPPAWRVGYRTNRDLETLVLYTVGATIPGSMVLAWFTAYVTHLGHGIAGTVAGVAVAGLTGSVMSWTWFLMAFGLAMDASPHHAERAGRPVRAFFRYLRIMLLPLVAVLAVLLLLIGLAGIAVSHL